MRILLINCVYNVGSTGKIVYDSKQYYESLGHEVYVAFGNKGDSISPSIYRFCTHTESRIQSRLAMIGRSQYQGLTISTNRLKKFILKNDPDVVHLHCVNGFCVNLYELLRFLGEGGYKTVITHHAEFYYTGSCGHAYECDQWYTNECKNCPRPHISTFNKIFPNPSGDWQKMKKAFSSFKPENLVFTSVSPWVNERAKHSPIVNHFKHYVVLNGLDTSVFHHYSDSFEILTRFNIFKKSKIVFHATAAFSPNDLNHPKGGFYVAELARRLPHVMFIVASIASINAINLPPNLILWGRTNTQEELARLYSIADLTLITSDRETFSMVVAESLCCGTRVVGFKAGGPESIALKEYGFFVEYGNIDKLQAQIELQLKNACSEKQLESEANRIYSKEVMAQNYLNIYKTLV